MSGMNETERQNEREAWKHCRCFTCTVIRERRERENDR